MLGFAGIVGVFVWRGMVEVCLDVSSFGYSLNPTYVVSLPGEGRSLSHSLFAHLILAPTVPLFGRLIPSSLEAGALCAPYKCTKSR